MSTTSTSNRRSSVSSVTLLDQERKKYPLLRVVVSLDQCSQPSDDGVSVRSRPLDFGSADDSDVDDENEEDTGTCNSDAETQTDDVAGRLNSRRRKGRRRTVFWSADEEEFLRRGVMKYGTGKWKKILIDGQDVFSKHRTNVDLKDKWKNMQKINYTNRKRTAEVHNLTPSFKQEEQPIVHHASRASAHKVKPSDDASEMLSVQSAESRTDQRTAVAVNRAVAATIKQEVDAGFLPSEKDENYIGEESGSLDSTGSYHPSEQIMLKFATDRSFPKFIGVRVSLDACKNVSALKKLLRSSILSDLSPNEEIQLIGLKSRQLFEDDELMSRCIKKKNGVDFFLVFEKAPEMFMQTCD